MADEINPNLNLIGPEVGGSINTWGGKLNANFATLDSAVAARILRSGDSMTGALGIIAGSELNPGLFFTGDNTGLYQPAANQLGLSVDGVGRLVISSASSTFTNNLNVNANLSYTGTLTGGTGVINIGSGQLVKDAAGNLGLGVTPSAWVSGARVLEIGAVSSIADRNVDVNNRQLNLYNNAYVDSAGVERYKVTDFATRYLTLAGGHNWYTAPSGTAGNPITFTQAMTLTQAGNLLVGTTVDSGYKLDLSLGGASGTTVDIARFFANAGSTAEARIVFGSTANTTSAAIGAQTTSGTEGVLKFYVESGGTLTEYARITSAGYFKASNTGVYAAPAGAFHESNNNQNTVVHLFQSGNTGSAVEVVNTNLPSGATGFHFTSNTGVTRVYQVLATGDVQNTNNSYGAISDAKLKENVVDAGSYLDRFMQVRFRNFNFIGSDLKQFGVIAQELETVFPGLVDETPDTEQVTKTRTVEVPAVTDEEGNEVTPATTREEEYTESVETGTVTKSVKYSVLALMAGKVIQEQQAIIQAQQAQIQQHESALADVLSRLSALESK